MENRCIPMINLTCFKELTELAYLSAFGYLLSDFLLFFCTRIRALYAQILEKDAVIKILNQRLHQDQGRKEEPSPRTNLLNTAGATLPPASSTPSISTMKATTNSRGKQNNGAVVVQRQISLIYFLRHILKLIYFNSTTQTIFFK